MSLEHAILGFLGREPMSGYDLKTKCFDREASAFWTADQAQVYRTLDRLVRDRKVTVKRIRQRGKPDRKVFTISPTGRESLSRWLSSAQEPPPRRDPFLLKLLFADALDDDALLSLLAEERAAHQRRLGDLRATLAARTGHAPHALDRPDAVARIALEGALASTRAAIDWIDDAADRVRAGVPDRTRDRGCGDSEDGNGHERR